MAATGASSNSIVLRSQGSGPSLFFIQPAPIHSPRKSDAESGPTVNQADALHGEGTPVWSQTRTFHHERDPFASGWPA